MSGNKTKKRHFRPLSRKRMSALEEEAMQTPLRTVIANFRRNKVAVFGLVSFVLIFLCCFVLAFIFPIDVTFTDSTQINVAPGFVITAVPGELKQNASAVDGGSSFGAGADKNGNVYLWGHLTNRLRDVPQNMGPIRDISAGSDHILALSEDGKLYTWGYNRMNLGEVPLEVQMISRNLVQIEAGYQISVVLDNKGNLYYWGNLMIMSIEPRDVQGRIKKFALNTTTALVLLDDGTIAALSGSLDTPFGRIPEEYQGRFVDVASTDKSAAGLTADGRVVIWGSDSYDIENVPERIQGHIAEIHGGRGHFTALLDDGTVASWGRNNFGQANAPKLSNIVSVRTDYFQNYAIDDTGKVYTWGLSGYLMGTDQLGRDVFARLLAGGRLTMTVGAVAVIISAVIGIIIGGFSGYYGGKADMVLMRFGEIVNAIPFLPLAIILSSIVRNQIPETGRIVMIMVILGVLNWPGLARLTRAQILSVRESEFVTAAKAMGIREYAIIFKHIFPNVISVVLVSITISLASSMLTESSLSFLGFGVMEPNPTWGNMLFSCMDSTVISQQWWRWLFPAVALGLSVLSINVVGNGLRDAIDPKANER